MKANVLKHLLWLVLFILPQHIPAQKFLFSKNYWHKGEITLKSGESYPGIIKYHLDYNLVELQVKNENITKTFGSRQLESFSFMDTLTKVERTFYSLPVKNHTGYTNYAFFELIGEGDFAVLTRERIVMKPHNKGIDLKGSGRYDLVLEDDFFFLDNDGLLKHCGKLPELADLFDIPMTDLKLYIKTNKVNMRHRDDFMNLITYYSTYTKKFTIKSRISSGQ
jgi:hypothetical protein